MSVALNGAAFAGYVDAFGEYLQGDTPDVLTPVAPLTGDSVAFKPDSEREYAKATDAGLIVIREKAVFVRAGLVPVVGDRYTFGGVTWQVAKSEPERLAGADWNCYVELVAEKSSALQRSNV